MTDKELRPVSERFTNIVIREFSGVTGQKVELSDFQKKLAQHLFIKVDQALRSFESKRKAAALPFVWNNINLDKLALDAIYRIDLGLDALIPNHIHPVPYMDDRLGKYSMDLRIGYAGQDYVHRRFALDPPVNVIYELVYETDEFRPIKTTDGVSQFEFQITQPFSRGNVIGGFGYVVYEDPRRNLLVLVPEDDFNKSQSKARSQEFWENYPTEMRYKTLVHRTTSHIPLDPQKTNQSPSFNKIREESKAIEGDFTEIDLLDSGQEPQPAQSPPPKRELDPTPPAASAEPEKKETEVFVDDSTARTRASIIEMAKKHFGPDAFESVIMPEVLRCGHPDFLALDASQLHGLNKWLAEQVAAKDPKKARRKPEKPETPKTETATTGAEASGGNKTETPTPIRTAKSETPKPDKAAPADQVKRLVQEMREKNYTNEDIKKLLHAATNKTAGWDNSDAPAIRQVFEKKEQSAQVQTEDEIEAFLRKENGK